MELTAGNTVHDTKHTRDLSILLETTESPDPTPRTLQARRWLVTLPTSLYMLVSPISSSIVAPALSVIQDEFRIPMTMETQMVLSIFVLVAAVGPLVVSPLSEVYGRRSVLQLTCLFYMPSARQPPSFVFRFLSGLGESTPCSARGKSLKLYYISPLVGPAVFYSTSNLNAVMQTIGLFALPETFPLQILQEKARGGMRAQGGAKPSADYYEDNKDIWSVIATVMMSATKRYGLIYFALSTFSAVWTDVYGESDEISGLNDISLYNGSVQAEVHWIMPNIGSVLFGFGIITGMQTITSYTVDAYPLHAASVTAALTVFRAFAGFGWCPIALAAR
ncbi:MFS general substrate transporter [Hypoxylon sp. FL1857]|nr:MFS general substrate transporter [Hypoxylon sp. FL1857]